MKSILYYLRLYVSELNKAFLLICILILSIAIYINYQYHLHYHIDQQKAIVSLMGWYLVFLTTFCIPYLLQWILQNKPLRKDKKWIFLILIAPLIFAWKMAASFHFQVSHSAWENMYWNKIIYWPLKLLIVAIVLFIIWKYINKEEQKFYGIDITYFKAKPYWWMLLIMIPLVAFASTQNDFLRMYPKLQQVMTNAPAPLPWWKMLLYELSYGSDFIGIELYFRGFLILGFTKWVGKDAILPMAMFYCTIHFGKPVGECISSFFGGMVLGVVTYHTQSIWGGLIVHLGIAWMMELGGYIGNHYF